MNKLSYILIMTLLCIPIVSSLTVVQLGIPNASLDNYVPYLGGNQNVNLGVYNLSASRLFGFINYSYILNAPSITGSCSEGYVVQNVTSTGVQCVIATSFVDGNYGDITLSDNTLTWTLNQVVDDNKIITGANIAVNKLAALTPDSAVTTDGFGVLTTASTTAAEIDFLSGVTSSIQGQLDAKAAPGSCPSGQVVQNTTTGGVQCVLAGTGSGSGNASTGVCPSGQVVQNITTGAPQCVAASSGGGGSTRELLTANRNYYVSLSGSDSNNGLSWATPFQTIQKAFDTAGGLDYGIYDVFINLADGTYDPSVICQTNYATFCVRSIVGSGKTWLQGNLSNPGAVEVRYTGSATYDTLVRVPANGILKVTSLKLSLTGSGGFHMLRTDTNGRLEIGENVNFGVSPFSHILCDGGYIISMSNYTVSGNAFTHMYMAGTCNGAYGYAGGNTLTFSSSPTFSGAFLYTTGVSYFQMFQWACTGTVSGSRYQVITNGVLVDTSGAQLTGCGNSAGATASGGQYVT